MGHGHSHGGPAAPASRRVRIVLAVVVGALALVTVVGLKVLWPGASTQALPGSGSSITEYRDATVTRVETQTCGPMACEAVWVQVSGDGAPSGPVALAKIAKGGGTPTLQVGDAVVVTRELSLTAADYTYASADYQRRAPLWLLAGLFAAAVIGVARWRGLAALVGIALTWAVLVKFLVPAILAGENAVAVALVASSVIMFVVLYLVHGINARTTTALIGTLVSLLVTGALAAIFVGGARLSGLASDEATFLANSGITVDLRGLLLCGIIIGSLGVLNDVTVTQASAVWEIHHADPGQSPTRLYRSGMRIGRDHIASTVYTLVLAYAGASLPLLILFVVGNARFADVATGEIVAEEIIRTLVGSIGLVASVPLTTLLAAVVASRQTAVVAEDPDTAAGPDPHAGPATTTETDASPSPLVGAAVTARPVLRDGPVDAPQAPEPPARTRPDRGQRRRDRRAARDASREATWQAPAAEREFWDQ